MKAARSKTSSTAVRPVPIKLIVLLLIVLHLTPVWLFKYFPTQDGSTHLHTAQVMKDYHKPEYTKFREYYKYNLSPFPNRAAQALLIPLMYLFPSLIAEKILVTIYAFLLPLSVMYLIESVNGRRPPPLIPSLLSLMFIHNFPLYMGFYSFVLSLPLYFFSLGYWWRNRRKLRIKQFLILNSLLFATYFSHLVSYVISLFSITFLALIYFAVESLKERDVKQYLSSIGGFGFTVASLAPSFALMCFYLRKSGMKRSYTPIRKLIDGLFPIETLYYISSSQKIIAYPVTILLLFLFLYTLWRGKLRLRGNVLEINLTERDYFLALSLAALVIYLVSPSSMARGGFINNRLILYPPLLLLPWLSDRYNPILKRIIAGFIVLLCLVNLVMLNYYVSKFNGVMKEFMSGVNLVGRNNAIIGLMRDRRGWFLRVEPYAGGTNYYCIDNGNVNLVNYQAERIYFGINFKPGLNRPSVWTIAYHPERIDFGKYVHDVPYIVAWGLTDDSDVNRNVLKHYKLIWRRGKLKIFEAIRHIR